MIAGISLMLTLLGSFLVLGSGNTQHTRLNVFTNEGMGDPPLSPGDPAQQEFLLALKRYSDLHNDMLDGKR